MKHLISAVALLCAAAPAAALPGSPQRPAGNTGDSFYVSGNKLYDPTGTEFRIRGVNRLHWDQAGASRGVPLSGANAERVAVDFAQSEATNRRVIDPIVSAGLVPIIGNWSGTCKGDPAILASIVNTWVTQAPAWQRYPNALINIANEWGPGALTGQPWPAPALPNYTWRDSYILAIQRMRSAGYLGTLVIDAPGCGQEILAVVRDGAAVLAADPQHNLMFDVHVYGNFYFPATAPWQKSQDYTTAMAALKETGLPLIIGEFGPGKSIGPSPTLLTPERVVADAEANGWGWTAWAWDDNNLPNCGANDGWFAMVTSCGKYTGNPGELTSYGRAIVALLKSTGAKHANFAP